MCTLYSETINIKAYDWWNLSSCQPWDLLKRQREWVFSGFLLPKEDSHDFNYQQESLNNCELFSQTFALQANVKYKTVFFINIIILFVDYEIMLLFVWICLLWFDMIFGVLQNSIMNKEVSLSFTSSSFIFLRHNRCCVVRFTVTEVRPLLLLQ